MKKTIHKWFWAWDFEKEEAWLNKMAAQGLNLCAVGFGTYTFEEGTPGEYIIRLEMLDYWPSHAESVQYIHFIEETGAEHVGSLAKWVYFRKKAGGQGFDLFSDIDSRVKHMDRILFITGIFFVLNFYNGINSLINFGIMGFTSRNVVTILLFVLSALLVSGFIRLFIKRQKLKKEKILHE